nr:glutamate-rich WD repeat-containing protein 1 [Tanacetum cinerariifolium]
MPHSLKKPKKAKRKNKGGAKKGEGSSSLLIGMSSIPAKVWEPGVDGLEEEVLHYNVYAIFKNNSLEMSPQQTIKHQCDPSTSNSHENNVDNHHNRNVEVYFSSMNNDNSIYARILKSQLMPNVVYYKNWIVTDSDHFELSGDQKKFLRDVFSNVELANTPKCEGIGSSRPVEF